MTGTNKGTVDGKAIIKDTIPEGTEFVEGSIEVDGSPYMKEDGTAYTEEDLASGINVPVTKDGSVELTFKVKIKELENGTRIENVIIPLVINDVGRPRVPLVSAHTVHRPLGRSGKYAPFKAPRCQVLRGHGRNVPPRKIEMIRVAFFGHHRVVHPRVAHHASPVQPRILLGQGSQSGSPHRT